jgi:pimeloyl-ACP methyl ester carboxylesterase
MRTDIDVRTPAGSRITGTATGPGTPDTPLLVCLPGGSYTARYFDVPGFSLLDVAEANGFTAIALDRPGYGGSDPLPAGDAAIAALWTEYGAGHPGVVLISHSIGSAVAVHIAAGQPAWPLLGIALHGVNTLSPDQVVGAWHSMPPGVPVQFSPEQRRMFMYGPDGTFAPDAVGRAEISADACPIEELLEIVGEWPHTAAGLAGQVRVPVHYVLAEHEALWNTGQSRVDAFAGMFTSAPRVDAAVARGVGHNIDHHYLGKALQLQQLAFALTCTPVPVPA